jgi:hypothetical protein
VTLFDADRNSLFTNFERVQIKTQVKFMTIINKPPPPSHQVISTKKGAIVASKQAKPETKQEEVSASGIGAPFSGGMTDQLNLMMVSEDQRAQIQSLKRMVMMQNKLIKMKQKKAR